MRVSSCFPKVILSLTIPIFILFTTFYYSSIDSQNHLHEHNQRTLIRAFPSWQSSPDNQDWCIPSIGLSSSTTTGLLYVKTPKTGSSTLSGVVLRIAHRNGFPGHPCTVYYDHTKGRTFKDRLPGESFLLASVREPKKRHLSNIFFEYVARREMEPTDDNIIDKLKYYSGGRTGKDIWAGFQVNYLSMQDHPELIIPKKKFNTQWLKEIVSEIVHEYDFLIITDRLDESLVVLHFLLGVELKDTIYLSAKVNYDDGAKGKCTKSQKAIVSPGVAAYMNSDEFEQKIAGDTMLYDAANACLDATIEEIGRAIFEAKLKEYRRLLALAQEKCASKAIFPCSEDGVRQTETNCYWRDSGCGYACLDELVDTERKVVDDK